MTALSNRLAQAFAAPEVARLYVSGNTAVISVVQEGLGSEFVLWFLMGSAPPLFIGSLLFSILFWKSPLIPKWTAPVYFWHSIALTVFVPISYAAEFSGGVCLLLVAMALTVFPFVGGGDEVLTFGGGVAYDSGRIFAHSGGMIVYALDAETGEELWRAETLTPFHSAPTAADGRVFVTTDDNELLALNAETGEILWTHRSIAETARLLTAPSPAVAGEVVIAPFTSGEIVALRVQNGAELWSDSLTRTGGLTPLSSINDIAASPVVLGDRVYAMSHSGVMAAFDLRSGERVWTLPAGGLHAPYLAGDFLFIVTTDAEVAAIDRTAGTVRWITQLPAFKNERRRRDRISWAGPILAGDRLIVASSEGDMEILDPVTGERTQDRDIGDPVFIAPVIAEETVVVFTDAGRLIAYR